MKSFFALATAFAFAIVPGIVIADVVPLDTHMRLVSNLPSAFVLGVIPPHSPGIPSGSALYVVTPGDGSGSDLTVFTLTKGTDDVGQIRTFARGRDNVNLCVTTRGAQSDPDNIATVENCDDNDPLQLWDVSEANPTVVSQGDVCLTIPDEDAQFGDRVTIAPCDSQEKPGQLWNAAVI